MNEAGPKVSLRDRFPALRKIEYPARGGKRVPFVQQLSASECGSACLAMVLAYHGKEVRLDEVRSLASGGRDGTTAQVLLEAARWFGLRGRGIRLDLEDLEYLEPGSILHWEFHHFVVFERLTRDGVEIVDPAVGRRRISLEQFGKSFTGVVLELEPGEGFVPQKRRTLRARDYLKRILEHSDLILRIGVTSLLIQVLMLSLPMLTGLLVDRIVPRADYGLLTSLAIGLLALVVFRLLSSMVRAHLVLNLQTNLDTQLTMDFVDHLVSLPYAFFQQRSAGDLMMRLNSNTTIREILTSSAFSAIFDGSMVSLYLILMFATHPSLGALVLVLGLLQATLFAFSRRRYRELTTEALQAQAKSQSYQVQMLAGIETLKASGVEHRAVEHWSNLFADVMNVSLKRGRLSALVDSLLGALGMACPLIILLYGALQVLSGSITLGTMLALNALAGGFLGPLSTLISTSLQLQLLGSYLDRVNDVLETAPEQDSSRVSRVDRLRGQITLEHVSFQFGQAAPMVVQDVCVDIQPGHFVAIVGKSGSGKSTLARLLLGLYVPSEGRILYDGTDLSTLEVHSVRRQLGIVPQHPYLFGDTLRRNIALADQDMHLDRIVEAAMLACIHEDIAAMPLGYETILVDGGASLAGGQRQRVALARALVHQPAVLLLDEATSALDALTELRILKNLAALPCTRIVIAHRLSTIMRADHILVMENGRVVEQGTHEKLLKCQGKYSELVSAQIEREHA